MTGKKLSTLIKTITVCASALLVLLAFVIVFQYVRLGNLKQESLKLSNEISTLTERRKDLENGIISRNGDDFIEDYARDELGKIKDGETIYIFK
ncbi:MAG: septum formation initiator family protein [Clostridia bacterium]